MRPLLYLPWRLRSTPPDGSAVGRFSSRGVDALLHNGATLPALSLVLITVVIQVSGVGTFLRYDRTPILAGAIWRLLTGHLVHIGWPHLLLNLAGLVLVWVLCGSALSPSAWWRTTVACAAGIGCGLLAFHPEVEWYEGLSGILHGWLMAGAVGWVCAGCYWDGIAIIIVLCTKIGFEQWHGVLPSSVFLTGGPIILAAHLYGTVSGLVIAVFETSRIKKVIFRLF